MFSRTDDPIADFNRYEEERQAKLEKLPKCDECGEYIQDDCLYEFNDTLICEECLKDNHRKLTEDYIE